jgi:hypothetical protein
MARRRDYRVPLILILATVLTWAPSRVQAEEGRHLLTAHGPLRSCTPHDIQRTALR